MAFDNVQYGPGLAYFPAASLSYGESCQMNFGGTPFKYPFFALIKPSIMISKCRVVETPS